MKSARIFRHLAELAHADLEEKGITEEDVLSGFQAYRRARRQR